MIWINKRLPFKGFVAMAVFPFIFVRKENEYQFSTQVHNHEKTHFEQQKELLFLLFYVWYILEYIIKLFIYQSFNKAYKNISFEREANAHEKDPEYLKNRKLYSFIKYVFKTV
jgi:hypothetical protein